MEFKCPECGKIVHRKIGNYLYKESGLDNVYLENIPVYKCSCGFLYASIFRIMRLNELIAQALLDKPSLLDGKEIKFLRKSLFLSSKAFAKSLGMGNTTISKWENGQQKHSEVNDRLIRMVYIILKGIRYNRAQKIIERLANIKLEKKDIDMLIIAEKFENDYLVSWKPIIEPQAPEVHKVWLYLDESLKTFTNRERSLTDLSFIKSNIIYSSADVLKTGTSLHSFGLR